MSTDLGEAGAGSHASMRDAGGGVSIQEVSHWRYPLRFYSPASSTSCQLWKQCDPYLTLLLPCCPLKMLSTQVLSPLDSSSQLFGLTDKESSLHTMSLHLAEETENDLISSHEILAIETPRNTIAKDQQALSS